MIVCSREQPENRRIHLHELVFGEPLESHRAEGVALASRLEQEVARILAREPRIGDALATAVARIVMAIIHITSTATLHLDDDASAMLERISQQVPAVLPSRPDAGT